MAEFNIHCPHCGTELVADEAWVGMELECPKCKRKFNVPPKPAAAPTPRLTLSPRNPAGMPQNGQGIPMNPPGGGFAGNPPPPQQQQFYGGNNTPYSAALPRYCTNCGREITANAAICIHCGVALGRTKNFCINCGHAVNDANQAICLHCGCSLNSAGFPTGSSGKKLILPSGKSTTVAMILSCVLPGVGQIYLGQTLKGVVLLVPCFLGLGCISWIIAMIDAYLIGQKLEAGKCVEEWEFF